VIVGKVLDMDEKTAIIMTDDFAFLNVVRTSEMAVGKKSEGFGLGYNQA